jgi:uncharacterized protein (TIGR00269 family)
MRCRRCRAVPVIELRRHNAAFCADCLLHHCQEQVRKAIAEHSMLQEGQRVLVAVSGGKDSLALWEILTQLGYEADGLYLGLGIGDYSSSSGRHARAFASARGLRLVEIDLADSFGFDIPGAARDTRRVPCSACGLSKRHLFDRAARDGGYDTLATGHNLDDEAAVLLGNVLRWSTDYLGRQSPVLPAANGFVRKVKPLIRLAERETAAYCVIRGIDYIVEECPMAEGNNHLGYKAALNLIEESSPGSKASFYSGFLDRALPHFRPEAEADQKDLGRCDGCGAPTPGRQCAFCRLASLAGKG